MLSIGATMAATATPQKSLAATTSKSTEENQFQLRDTMMNTMESRPILPLGAFMQHSHLIITKAMEDTTDNLI